MRLNHEDEALTPLTQQEFYNHVSCAFEVLRNGKANETTAALHGEDRKELIMEKFFYAVCSARWMFNYTAAEVKRKFLKQFRKCNLFKDLVGVDHQWVGYPSEDGVGFSIFFASQYAARLASTLCRDGR